MQARRGGGGGGVCSNSTPPLQMQPIGWAGSILIDAVKGLSDNGR